MRSASRRSGSVTRRHLRPSTTAEEGTRPHLEEGTAVPSTRALPTRQNATRNRLRATLCMAWAWVVGVLAWVVQATTRIRYRWGSSANRTTVREASLRELGDASRGIPFIDEEVARLAGSAASAAATAATRATRAPRTETAARQAASLVANFLSENPSLLAAPGQPSAQSWDTLLEAFVFAEAADEAVACPWHRARGPQAASAARRAGSVRSLLERLGYARGATWAKSRAMERAFGVRDEEDVTHYEPIFVWEVVEGLRLAPPRSTPWDLAGAAMITMGSLAAKASGGAHGLTVGDVTLVDSRTIQVEPRMRPKVHRHRATGRARRRTKPTIVRHWLVEEAVVPLLDWHRRRKSPPTALLFPAVTQSRSRAATDQGFWCGGQWVEPMRQWDPRAVRAAMEKFIPNLGGRSYHGFRGGNQRELRRNPEVAVVTRRALHGRALKAAIGSEASYDEVFAEDFARATERLGELRIERGRSGLMAVTAVSASQGRNPSDWVALPNAVPLTEAGPGRRPDTSDSSSDTGSDESVVGDGGRDTRRTKCGRCGRALGARDYGWLCDQPGCSWAACHACHPGGKRAPLWCPAHAPS